MGEIPAASGIVGVAVIGLGALVLNPSGANGSGFHPLRALREEKGSLAMLGYAWPCRPWPGYAFPCVAMPGPAEFGERWTL